MYLVFQYCWRLQAISNKSFPYTYLLSKRISPRAQSKYRFAFNIDIALGFLNYLLTAENKSVRSCPHNLNMEMIEK